MAGDGTAADERAARLDAALRANLRRRKAQARGVAAGDDPPVTDDLSPQRDPR